MHPAVAKGLRGLAITTQSPTQFPDTMRSGDAVGKISRKPVGETAVSPRVTSTSVDEIGRGTGSLGVSLLTTTGVVEMAQRCDEKLAQLMPVESGDVDLDQTREPDARA